MARHGRKLWWIHSLYALALGVSVVLFARKGFAHARWLVASLGGAWLLLLIAFRLFGSGVDRDAKVVTRGAKVRYFVVTYALKNLYQGMLFFLLPFYWQSTTFDSPNRWFVVVLAVCALISTLDVLFDSVVMRWRSLASVLYAVTLFGCLNLVIPALLPKTRALYSLVGAAGASAFALWTFHVGKRAFTDVLSAVFAVLVLAAGVAGFAAGAYELRVAIPPVPMYVRHGGVGPAVLEDGRLKMEVTTIHSTLVEEMIAVTEVDVPGGTGADRMIHVWRKDGMIVVRRTPQRDGTRLTSRMSRDDLPADLVGKWSVDVRTEDGQIVGRARFRVIE